MKTLITEVGSYRTGDAIATAILAYWLALSRERSADVVAVPFLTPGGERSRLELTMGWTTCLAAVDADPAEEEPDLDDPDLIEDLATRARTLIPRSDAAASASVHSDAFAWDEY